MKKPNLSRAADQQWWLIYAMFALSPVLVLRSAAEPFHLPKATFIILIAIAVAVAGVYRATAEKSFSVAATPLLPPYLLYLSAAGVATVSSAAPRISVWGEYRYFTGLVFLVAVGVVAVAMLQDPQTTRYRRLAYAIAVGAAPVTIYGLLQLAGADPFQWFGGPSGVFSTFGNPNFLAGYLVVAFPVVVTVAAVPRSPTWARVAAGGLAVAMAVAAVATRSAQGPVGLLIGAILPIGLMLRRRLEVRTFRFVIAGGLLSLLGAGVALRASVVNYVGEGFQQRTAIWEGAVSIFQAHPLSGTGLGTFGLFFARHRPVEHARTGFINPEQAHNVALNHLAEGGLLLLIPWLAVLAVVLFLLHRGLGQLQGERQVLLAGFGGGWLAYQAQGSISIDLPVTVLLEWTLAATIAGLAAGPERRRQLWSSKSRARELPTSAVLLRTLAFVCAITVGWVAIRPLRADVAALSGFRAVNQGQAPAGLEEIERATELAPFRSTYWLLLASARDGAGDERGALEAMENGADADVGSSQQALQAAEWADRYAGDIDRAAAWYEEALARDPLNPQVLDRVSDFYDSVGSFEKSTELEELAEELRSG